MRAETVLHPLGRVVTRLLLHTTIRTLPGALQLYSFLYCTGKKIAESKECQFLRTKIDAGDTVLDIGANLGFYTTLFAEAVGPNGRVIAFEPDPLMAHLLRSRTRSFACVRSEQIGLHDTETSAVLYCSRGNRADNRLAPSHTETVEQVRVSLQRLDDFVRTHRLQKIDGMKMDVQGSEIAVLRSMSSIPLDVWPKWIFFEFSPEHLRGANENPQEIWRILSDRGYTFSILERGIVHPMTDMTALGKNATSFTNIFAERTV